MSLRKRRWKSGKSIREGWMIDVTHRLPDGTTQRIRKMATATDRGLAVEEERQILTSLVKGEYRANSPTATKPAAVPTVAQYATTWLAAREARGLGSVHDDRTRLVHYVLPVLGDVRLDEVRPRHVRDLIRQLRLRKSRKGGVLAPRTVRHAFFTLSALFSESVADELVATNPCVLGKGELPDKVDKDPTWRAGAVFSAEEVAAILSSPKLPADRKVVYALFFLADVRFGEGAALRWKDYEVEVAPLGRLRVARSYNTRTKQLKGVKTDNPREVPVHPALAGVLAEWRDNGWVALVGRKPRPDDLIVPSRLDPQRCRSVTHGLQRFHEDLERVGLRSRRQHDARRTFISLARAGGAPPDVVRWVSHGPTGSVIDAYTTLPWETLCAAVKCVGVDLQREGAHAAPPIDPRHREGT